MSRVQSVLPAPVFAQPVQSSFLPTIKKVSSLLIDGSFLLNVSSTLTSAVSGKSVSGRRVMRRPIFYQRRFGRKFQIEIKLYYVNCIVGLYINQYCKIKAKQTFLKTTNYYLAVN